MSHLNDGESGWLGGIIDGEGCIHLTRSTRDPIRLEVQVKMTCEETVRRVHKLFATGVIVFVPRAKTRVKWKDTWLWRASGKDALFALKLVQLFIFTKRKQLILAFQFMEECYVGPGNRLSILQKYDAVDLYNQMKALNKRGASDAE